MEKLDTHEELAAARFGKVEGLALVRKTTLEMAKHYADRFGLDLDDPEVSMITSVLAFTRHKEMTLLVGCESDLQKRVIEHPTAEYGEVLFTITRTGAHKDIHKEIDRLHARANKYIKELRQLREENINNNNSS